MFYFSKNDIIFLHSNLIDYLGGIDGIRDEGMLDSALNAPLQTFDGESIYPSTIEKIARLSFGLALNHSFIDGNKRIAFAVLDIGLKQNGFTLTSNDKENIDEFIDLASGKIKFKDFLDWVEKHSSFK